jgi:hypothetical protein
VEIGDRVYHKGTPGNGIIRYINHDLRRDRYGVEFFWASHKDEAGLHDLGGRLSGPMGKWCSNDSLVLLPTGVGPNRVTMIGGRSLDRLIRMVCEIPRRRPRDGSDIVMSRSECTSVL